MSASALACVPKPMSLFDLVSDTCQIADLIFALDDEGAMTPEIEEQLQTALVTAIAGTRSKVDKTAGVLHKFETAEGAARAEIERLQKRVAALTRNRERLEFYVLHVLATSKLDRIDGDTVTLSRRRNPPRVEIVDESRIPVDFLRFPPEPPPPPALPNKPLILATLKAAPDAVPGCRIADQTFRLVRS